MTGFDEARRFFEENGYFVARGLFTTAEAAEIRDHYMELRKQGPKPGDMGGDAARGAADPLNEFARFINMQDYDRVTRRWMDDARLAELASVLVGQPMSPSSCMLYFKPPGARGQALHQDNQYIRKEPIAASWVALDRCDEANGQMIMLPGSQREGLLPVQRVDETVSFVSGGTVVPEGYSEAGIAMEPGDVLFFGGLTIHGSYPNETHDRFRRAFIVHFIANSARDLPEIPGTSMADLK